MTEREAIVEVKAADRYVPPSWRYVVLPGERPDQLAARVARDEDVTVIRVRNAAGVVVWSAP